MKLKIRVQGYQWSQEINFYKVKQDYNKFKPPNKITLFQDRAHKVSMILRMHWDRTERGTKKFFVYTDGCIINETDLDLVYYRLKEPDEHKLR